MRTVLSIILVLLLAAAGVYIVAGRAQGPAITITQPGRFVGQTATLDLTVDAPKGRLERLDVYVEQKGQRTPVASLANAQLRQEGPDRVRLQQPFGKQTVPSLQEGPARIVVIATRPVLRGLRHAQATVIKDVQVRLEPPRVSIVSTHHYINHGGSEIVVYRVTPPDVVSGVKVGDTEYPGYPASGAAGLANVQLPDPSMKVAFFALLYDQDMNVPISLFARDEAGNSARADFEYRVFPKPMRRSNIRLDDKFLNRVVPAILEHTPDLKPQGDTLAKFLAINGELRRKNAEQIASFAQKTEPRILFSGPFQQMGNSQVEAAFADHRTYFYQEREVDQQVHLGFDLAVTANVPVRAAQNGHVLFADYLGIYGNCVIIDHGMGVQSLYAHLSSFDTKAGQTVEKDQVIARSGMTGLAGGDHLHFTMLVQGHTVTPVEWWDPHWIEDRIVRKLREAAAGAPVQP